jgi:DnaJ family protein C protein 17
MSSSSSSKKKIVPPEGDPYAVLGVAPGADDAAITKAYRKAALKYHPDKQQAAGTNDVERERMATKFHQLQGARAFLLDADLAASRAAYDTFQRSRVERARYETQRTSTLGATRKRRREELAAAEAAAQSRHSSRASSGTAKPLSTQEGLRREGAALREKKAAADAAEANAAAADDPEPLAARQVRFKWSRKRMETSPSEESLAQLLGTQFGSVTRVEFLGLKGNAALVTFAAARSVAFCILTYPKSSVMRATALVATATTTTKTATAATPSTTTATASTTTRDHESVAEWQARRAAAARALLEEDEDDETANKGVNTTANRAIDSFLPPLPPGRSTTPWERLAVLETTILGAVASSHG